MQPEHRGQVPSVFSVRHVRETSVRFVERARFVVEVICRVIVVLKARVFTSSYPRYRYCKQHEMDAVDTPRSLSRASTQAMSTSDLPFLCTRGSSPLARHQTG
jgi:hypothetical protein